jgi:hypothetical protein
MEGAGEQFGFDWTPDGDLLGLNNFLGVKIFEVVMMLFLWSCQQLHRG